jgi:hypothetical protein
MSGTSLRRRLPARRRSETVNLTVGNMPFSATIGFDEAGTPKEIFLAGGKTGSAMDFLLADAAVVLNVGLQFDIPPTALAKSIARVPEATDGPATKAASIIGAALDLLVTYETPQNG